MSSSQGQCADRTQAENPPRREAVTWPWPVGARRVLAGAVILAVMGLAVASRGERSSSGGTSAVTPELVVDPNTAPPRVLTALPRVGPTLVREWVAARADRPFTSLEDAQDRVRGLGPATLLQIAPHMRFEPSTQFDVRQIASSSSDQRVGKSRSTRRKPTRSKSARQTPQSSRPRLVAESSELEAQRQLSIARHDR
jgi:competence protein ComEA